MKLHLKMSTTPPVGASWSSASKNRILQTLGLSMNMFLLDSPLPPYTGNNMQTVKSLQATWIKPGTSSAGASCCASTRICGEAISNS